MYDLSAENSYQSEHQADFPGWLGSVGPKAFTCFPAVSEALSKRNSLNTLRLMLHTQTKRSGRERETGWANAGTLAGIMKEEAELLYRI